VHAVWTGEPSPEALPASLRPTMPQPALAAAPGSLEKEPTP